MKVFRLEVALQSNVTPAVPGIPVTMAYAFTDYSGNYPDSFVADGQNLKLVHKTVPKGAWIMFGVYDTATYPPGTTPPEVTAVRIDCAKANTTNGDSPFVADPSNPEGPNKHWINKSSITAKPQAPLGENTTWSVLEALGQYVSAGCNVKGRRWDVGPFIALKEGAYEFTVTVQLSNGRTFQVDPEMEVTGG